MTFDYQVIGDILGQVVQQALPIGILFYLAEMLVSMFLKFAFPKRYREQEVKMENDIISNVDANVVDDISDYSVSTTAYDWYDYEEVLNRLDIVIENQNKSYDLLNQGFTFLSFIIVIYFLYIFIKNMIRKQEVLC